MNNGLVSAHALLADWLFLIAFALLAVCSVLSYLTGPSAAPSGPSHGRYVTPGVLAALALLALAWFVL